MKLGARRGLLAAGLTFGIAASAAAAAQPKPNVTATPATPGATAASTAGAASASTRVTASASTGSAGIAAADAGASTADAGTGALPPGHPSVEQDLPSGHPPLGANPHSGGAQRHRDTGDLFQAPEDTVQDDPTLPPGVLVVSVQDADGNPVPDAKIDVSILRSSVAKGDSRESTSKQAGADGSVRFENLTSGSGVTYGISVSREGGMFSMPSFALGPEAGKRAVLHVYETTSDLNGLLVGMQGIIYVQLRQDSISVEQLFQVFNLGRVAWLPEVKFSLPEGYKAFTQSERADDMRFEEVKDSGVAIRGTVSPGRHESNYRFQVPLAETAQQKLQIELPPRMATLRVMAEASKSMTLEVAGFPAAQRTQNRDGKKILVTEKQSLRADGGLKTVEITLGGLPTPSPSRWVALGLAGMLVAGALAFAFVRRGAETIDEDAQRELIEARDALLDEFVELERARKRGDIGPKTYTRVRGALLDALARIVGMLEDGPANKGRASSQDAAGSLKPRSAAAPRS